MKKGKKREKKLAKFDRWVRKSTRILDELRLRQRVLNEVCDLLETSSDACVNDPTKLRALEVCDRLDLLTDELGSFEDAAATWRFFLEKKFRLDTFPGSGIKLPCGATAPIP